MCSYYSKGTADYVGVWDFDDFLIPRGPNENVLDLLKNIECHNTDVSLSSQGGLADSSSCDNQSHPFCYLLLASEDTYIDAQPRGQVLESE
jgi:Glycosyltransferase family 92